MRSVLRCLSRRHSTAVAYLALFAALGGTTYAAVTVTGKNIKDRTVTGRDVKNRSLGTSKLSATALSSLAGQRGPTGPQGPKGDGGERSPAGPIGATGPQGTTGLAGPQGPAGAQGPSGISGWEYVVTPYPGGRSLRREPRGRRSTARLARKPGALMALADSLGGICAYLNLPPGAQTSTISSTTTFVRAVRAGEVTAVARPLHAGRTVIVVQADMHDDSGRRVAQVTQTQAVLVAGPSS